MGREKKEFGVRSSEFGEGQEKGGTMRKLILALGLVALVGGLAGAVTTDSVLLTITPAFNLSVNISSTTQTFGSNIALKTSATICVGQIMNDGNVSSKWQKMTASASAGANSSKWTLLTDGYTATDEFRLLVITTGTAVSPTTSGSCIVGTPATIRATTSMTDLTEGGAASPTHAVSETKSLWVSIMMPVNITKGDEQTITLSVTAVAP